MKVTLKKKDIIKAIETNELIGGSWIDPIEGLIKQNPNCRVCAVGAILRNKLSDNSLSEFCTRVCYATYPEIYNDEIEGMLHADNRIEVSLDSKLYLAAISEKFEYLYDKYKTPKTIKKHLINFIKKEIPKEFTINL